MGKLETFLFAVCVFCTLFLVCMLTGFNLMYAMVVYIFVRTVQKHIKRP